MFSARQNFYGGTVAQGKFFVTQANDNYYSYMQGAHIMENGDYYGCFRVNNGTTNIYSVLVKFDINSNVIWQKKITGPVFWSAVGLTVDNSGNVYVLIDTNTTTAVMKFSNTGSLTWQKVLSGTNRPTSYTPPVLDSTGSNLFILITDKLVKIDSSGNLVLSKRITSTGASASYYGLTIDGSNNVYVTGNWYSGTIYYASIYKFTSTLTLTWSNFYGNGTQQFQGTMGSVDSNGNIYLFLGTANTTQGILKVASDSTYSWAYKFNSTTPGSDSYCMIGPNNFLYLVVNTSTGYYVFSKMSTGATPVLNFSNSLTMSGGKSITFNPDSNGTLNSINSLFAGGIYNGTVFNGSLTVLPLDGSGTGSYVTTLGNFTYSPISVTISSITMAASGSPGNITNFTITLSTGTATISDASATYTTASIIN